MKTCLGTNCISRLTEASPSPAAAKSSGGGSSKVSTHDFDKLHTEGWFRDKHHPEKQATALQAQRARAQLAAAQLKTAVREGAFPGPALRAPLVGDGAAKKQPRLRVVRIDNVPGVALAHAYINVRLVQECSPSTPPTKDNGLLSGLLLQLDAVDALDL